MKPVNTVKTTTKRSFENFKRQLLSKEIHVKYLENKAFLGTNLLWNQKLVIKIRLTSKQSINQ